MLHRVDALCGEYHLANAAGPFAVEGHAEFTPAVLERCPSEQGLPGADRPHGQGTAGRPVLRGSRRMRRGETCRARMPLLSAAAPSFLTAFRCSFYNPYSGAAGDGLRQEPPSRRGGVTPPVQPRRRASAEREAAVPVHMELKRIIISEIHEQQVILLKEVEGDRNFSIMIGIFEATSIDRRVKRLPSPAAPDPRPRRRRHRRPRRRAARHLHQRAARPHLLRQAAHPPERRDGRGRLPAQRRHRPGRHRQRAHLRRRGRAGRSVRRLTPPSESVAAITTILRAGRFDEQRMPPRGVVTPPSSPRHASPCNWLSAPTRT